MKLDAIECPWVRLAPLTEFYVGVLLVSALVFALAYVLLRRSEVQSSGACTPLLAPRRDAWVDTMRLLLTMTIITGHFIAIPVNYVLERAYWMHPMLAWINLFAIPGFALLSGHLSKAPMTAERASRVLIFVLLPYLFIKFILCLWTSWAARTVMFINPIAAFNPFGSDGVEWYLAVLLQWRFAIVFLRPCGRKTIMTLALIVGLGSGFWVAENNQGCMLRACSFFPFFAAGYAFDLNSFRDFLEGHVACQVSLRAMFLGTLAALFYFPLFSTNFTEATEGDLNFDYTSMVPARLPGSTVPLTAEVAAIRLMCGSEWAFSFVHRLVRYELGALLVAGLVAWMPSSCTLAPIGRNVMYPYLLHSWLTTAVIMPFLYYHPITLYSSLQTFTLGGYVWLYMLIIAPALTLVLASAPVRLLTGWIIEPTWAASLLLSEEHAAHFSKTSGKSATEETLNIYGSAKHLLSEWVKADQGDEFRA